MSGHTPGPWFWRLSEYDNSEGLAITADDGTLIVAGCGRCGSPYMNGKNPKADAALLAAAPLLLEALKILHDEVDDYQERNKLGAHNNHAMVLARDAINKAEGRT